MKPDSFSTVCVPLRKETRDGDDDNDGIYIQCQLHDVAKMVVQSADPARPGRRLLCCR
jgi:hypothetical protein